MKKKLITLLMLVCVSTVYSAHHELDKSEIIDIAMSAAPANVSGEATIMSADGSILRAVSYTHLTLPTILLV